MSALTDFQFFEQSDLDVIGADDAQSLLIRIAASPTGATAERAWKALDGQGKIIPCREPERLIKAMRSKKSWNLQIKEWAADLSTGWILTREELDEYTAGLPEWIKRATLKQATRLVIESQGYIPRYLCPV